MNLTITLGNITRDLNLTYTPKGTPVLDMGIAVNEVWTDDAGQKQKSVTYLDVRWWGQQAETVANYFCKGKPILVTGRLTQEEWTDKETGKPRRKTLILGKSWEFAGGDPVRGGKHEPSTLPTSSSGETIFLRRRVSNPETPPTADPLP